MSTQAGPHPTRYRLAELLNSGIQPLPDLDGDAFQALREGVKIGRRLADPITVSSDGVLIDGHQRARALMANGRSYIDARDVVVLAEANRGNALEYAVRLNVNKRHLTIDQKAGLARALQRERRWSQAKIADLFGVSRPAVSQWLAATPAPAHGPVEVEGKDGKTYTVEPPGRPPAKVRQSGEAKPAGEPEATVRLLDDGRKLFGQKGRARTLIVNLAEMLERGQDLSVLSWVERDGLAKDLERLRRAVEASHATLGALADSAATR
jgi:hypothetical protein